MSTTTATVGGPLDPLEGIHIVDCDAHFTEPADLWSSRVSANLADTVPQQRTVDGRTGWFLGDEMWASTGGNTIRRGREKVLGEHIIQPFGDVDPCAWSVSERLDLMDSLGIFAQVLYPNGIGFASNHIFAIENVEQRRTVLKIYNDFLCDVQHESGGRLLPQAMLPIWDMDLLVEEMSRLISAGITGFTLSDRPELIGLPELSDSFYAPMWDLFNESGAVANFHIGAGATQAGMEAGRARRFQSKEQRAAADARSAGVALPSWRSLGEQRRLAVSATQGYMSNVRIIVNLCMSPLFDRYPKLRIVSAESGIGWIPFVLEALEYQFDEMVTDPDELTSTERRPTEYFRDHIYVMFWFERVAAQKLIEDVGAGNVLVETDIPHPTCLYPGAREHFAQVMSGLTPELRRRVLQDNAAELYGLTLPGVA